MITISEYTTCIKIIMHTFHRTHKNTIDRVTTNNEFYVNKAFGISDGQS